MAIDSYSTQPNGLAIRETTDLISSLKVEGTAVYNHAGETLGSLESFMVNKASGHVEYAGLQFGGLFGIGSDHYPIPWQQLHYDSGQGGYVVNLDRATLEKAPRYSSADEPSFDVDYGREIDDYYRPTHSL